jgi:hypothetical protein
MTQGVQKEIRALSAIEPERHFVQVGREMFCADLVPRSHDAALQERECRLDGVGMNVSSGTDVFFFRVIDTFVFEITDSRFVSSPLVGDDNVYVGADVFLNVLRQRAGLSVLCVKESQIAIALTNADHYFFLSGGSNLLPVLPSPESFSANIGFVHLNRAFEHYAFGFFHGRADAMAEIPSGFVANSDGSLDLVGRHSLASFTEQQRNHEPFTQSQVGVVKDRSSGDRELIVALFTVQETAIQTRKRLSVATRAFRAIRPPEPFKQFAALLVGIKQFSEVRESHSERPIGEREERSASAGANKEAIGVHKT